MVERPSVYSSEIVSRYRDDSLASVYLKRTVHLEILLPFKSDRFATGKELPVLYLNDGQDLDRLHMIPMLDSLYRVGAIQPLAVVGIHAGDRIQEYGVASQPDYLNRGAKADLYTQFIRHELLPYIQKHYPVAKEPESAGFAGFSLGGLSAFDLVWRNPDLFRKVGVFSGSFWWRSKGLDQGYTDADRIMHAVVRSSKPPKDTQFWLQTGTLDETDDRDQDGIIDSIDDTLDLIAELERKGFRWKKNIFYREVTGGQHDQETWSRIMPEFLTWAFPVR